MSLFGRWKKSEHDRWRYLRDIPTITAEPLEIYHGTNVQR
jgi:hypothetical protein